MLWFKAHHRQRRYDDLAFSVQEHLDEKIEDLIESGMSREEAEYTARREFGNVTLINERSREIWQWPVLESIWADLRFALRQLVKAPGFTATAVLTLSLGIAVNATMFSLISAFLLGHLPGRNPQEVVVVSSVNPYSGEHADTNLVSAPNYLAWRGDTNLFNEMAAADEFRTVGLTGDGQPETIQYAAVSPNYFQVFGISPQLGRSFTNDEDQPGRSHVVILSHGLWEARFGSDPGIIGRAIRLNREEYSVIGVMPEDFRLIGFVPQLWTPLVLSAADQTAAARKERSLYLFARLARGITLPQACSKLKMLAKTVEADYPEIEHGWGASARALPDFLVYNFRISTALGIIMCSVSFILLIACANLAGLLLTRAVGRQKELAIRLSIGAGRMRIVRQLATEGLLIALLGGIVSVLVTYAGIGLLRASLDFDEYMAAAPVSLDRKVLLYIVGISLASAILSSLVPAVKSARMDVNTNLKNDSRTSSASRSHSRLRAFLVSGEIALALFLLTGTSLLIRGVFLLDHQELGFRTDQLLTATMALDHAQYADEKRQRLFAANLIAGLEHLPGVRDVAIASNLPATGAPWTSIVFKGDPPKHANEQKATLDVVVTSTYFHAVGLSVRLGRAFSEADTAATPPVAVVNQEFVRRYLKDKNPLGMELNLDIKGAPSSWRQVVGVVSDVKSYSEETRVDPEVYESFSQRPVSSFSVLLRANAEPNALIPALRQTVSQMDPELPLSRVMSMDSVIDQQRNGNPFFTHILALFAVLALLLATVGIYGLVAYSVGQRTHEIGIRMAVGAKTADILRLILHQGLMTAVLGSLFGVAMALPLPKLFDAMFAGVQFDAPALHLVVLAAILLVAAFATYIPAVRATRIDPKTALRNQ